jgi:hypothetical protein
LVEQELGRIGEVCSDEFARLDALGQVELSKSTCLRVCLWPGVASGAGPEAFLVRWDAFDLMFESVPETAAVRRGYIGDDVSVLEVRLGIDRAVRYLL